jgi:hypothetical protein
MQQVVNFASMTSEVYVGRAMESRWDLPTFISYLAILALIYVVLLSKLVKAYLNLIIA